MQDKMRGVSMKRKMQNLLVLVLLGTVFSAILLAPGSVQAQEERGPPVDVIYLDVRTSQDVGVGDTAAGKTDVFLWSASEAVWKRMPLSIINSLKLVKATTGFWSLVFNPVQDDPSVPGVVTTTATPPEVHFNPFAIKEVRYSMNWLVNRKYIIEEILAGGGSAMYSPVQSSELASDYVEHVYSSLYLGTQMLTAEGHFSIANQTINDALTEAATTLATYGYTLYQKSDGTAPAGFWWTFKGNWTGATEETVTLKFYIRIEDERHEEGLYIADQIEKTGLKVERLERDRITSALAIYYTDPKDYAWNIYTEGWVSMSEWLYPESNIAQLYAPWYAFMPGWGNTGWWSYANDTIDAVSQKVVYGPVASVDEYWNLTADTIKLGIQESVRVFVTETWEYFAVNPRVSNIAYGAVSGLWPIWPFRTASTPDKILRATQFSSAGALFMSAWNPVGGFTDVYSELIWKYIRDYADYPHPMTAEHIPVRTTFTVEKGDTDVPTTAIVYNSTADAWENVGAGTTAAAKVTFNYMLSNWHHGKPMTMADILNTWGFMWEWSTEDYSGDPYYSSRYAGSVAPMLGQIGGIEVLNSTAITVYGSYTHPISDAVTADFYAVWPTLPWEVLTSMEYVVVNGGPVSSKSYGWFKETGIEWIDMIVPDHVTDIKEAMSLLKAQGYLSNYIKVSGYSPSAASVDEGYTKAIDWANANNHVAISNGPFYLKQYNPTSMFAELRAFRDSTYPFGPVYWQTPLFLQTMVIRKVVAPTEITVGDSIPIDVYPLVKTEFPVSEEELATTGYIEARLKDSNGTTLYSALADFVLPGLFSLTMPGNATENLEGGIYTLDISAAIGKGLFPEYFSLPISIAIPKYTLTIGVSPLAKGTTSPGVGTLSYEKGSNVTVTAIPAEGYRFEYWELDGVPISSQETITVSVDQAHSLIAHLGAIPQTQIITPEISLAVSVVALGVAVVLLLFLWTMRMRFTYRN